MTVSKPYKKPLKAQKIINDDIHDTDIIAIAQNGEMACASVIMYRGGRLFDKASYFLGEKDDSVKMREDFLMQYYSSKDSILRKISSLTRISQTAR